MKHPVRSFLLLILSATLVAACSNDDNPSGNTGTAAGTMTASANGTAITTEKFRLVDSIRHGSYAIYDTGSKRLSIAGTNETTKDEILLIITGITVGTNGTFSIGGSTVNYASYTHGTVDSTQQNFHAYETDITRTGSISITKLDTLNHLTSGVFSFKGKATAPATDTSVINVLNGTFVDLPVIMKY